ncbi:MATE family efflux transporter [Clostridium sp.]|uniref:MATE family efflux transporter n=1 Tax=Clostridium sp. TaxID=1506 RepID=UPI002FC8ACDA
MELLKNKTFLNKTIIKDVLSLALPAVGEMILYMMIWVIDTIMVGKYGGELAVSTVGISSEILYTFSNILIAQGIAVAITSIVARRYGAKEFNIAEEYASFGFAIGTLISIITTLVIYIFAENFLNLAGAQPEVIALSLTYINIVCIGLSFNMMASILSAIQRAYGNTKTPLITSFIAVFINLGLDAVLIFGLFGFPELGIKGAAIATAISHVLAFLYSATYTYKKSLIKVRLKYIINLSISKIRILFKLSIPASLQEGAYGISRLATTFMIMYLGTTAFAANQITLTLESISFMPGWGFAVAATTLVGNKVGEKNYKKAKEYAYACTFLSVVIMLVFAVLFLTIPTQLIKLFIDSKETKVIALGASCLMVAALEQPTMAVSMVMGGALKGAGDTKTPFLVAVITSWFIRLPLVFYFIYLLKLSVVYFWVICVIQWTLDGLLLFIFFKKQFKKIVLNEF